jgi:RimJ/RimL family protein N-acetyltransferase
MLRHANPADIDFIYELIMSDAKDGHYNRDYCRIPEAANGLRVELSSILTTQIRPNGLKACGYIYELNKNQVGFVIISAAPENKWTELLMASISQKLRNKKHGKKMLTTILHQYKGKNALLFARCAHESEVMYQFLLKNGFRHVATGEEGVRGMLYEL